MPTAFDPDQAVSVGLLGATGPVQVTFGHAEINYFDYTNRAGIVVAKTVAAIIRMFPEGEVDEAGDPKGYSQVYSIGDPKTHHPSPDKSAFEGPLVKGSNFNFFIENLINAGFPKHLLAPGNIKVLDGVVAMVEQKKPPKREIAGKQDDSANKPQVVAIKVIHPAPGEAWPPAGKPANLPKAQAVAGAKKPTTAKAVVPQKPVQPPALPTTAPNGNTEQVSTNAESLVTELITKAGDAGYSAKDGVGSLAKIGKEITVAYMKKMQADAATFPPNQRAQVAALVQNLEWLTAGERPWVGDAETGMLVAA